MNEIDVHRRKHGLLAGGLAMTAMSSRGGNTPALVLSSRGV